MLQVPAVGEYAPYYEPYIRLVSDGNLLERLEVQRKQTKELFEHLTEKQATFRYSPNKWSMKEVLGHITDTERYLSYRLFCIARGETKPLPGHDENLFVETANFNNQSMEQLLNNFLSVRQATLQLIKTLQPTDWLKLGNANGYRVTVRAQAYIIAGHEMHHQNIIKERYLSAANFPK
ncbi:DinB family protein [Caldibacillus lycopersici]|uniref:DinB family protein n=1 Tax=Perspicuibacillus lycopersici TaxID=1325689 RepID=A0AAE3LPA2_9BACI|nr:DinB family protein [Perspicuibacillus lycopersici]MCU9614727.1 DinB family protein [Perspicuibacillus lycopersici]